MYPETPVLDSSPHSPPGFDEASFDDGSLRPHWGSFSGLLTQPNLDELEAKRESIRRYLAELGVTYNVYSDAQGHERPWGLDLFPLIISAGEWRSIERGLAQRTRIFNLILDDLYGDQCLLAEGILPPELVFSHPAFLRPCKGIRAPNKLPLVLHAVNLARRVDGTWCVLSDRTQSPSGLGYALANRIALARTLPEAFREAQVQRLAPFFISLREALCAAARSGTRSPTLALLTPGPFNETYFEHSFLARYLGFPLVEGGDLTLSKGGIHIKTLEGLRRIDVLLRRVDDAWSDPLELRSDSCLGIPGLLEALRQNQVSVVNSVGSAWLESPALPAFLPRICRFFLGEDLLLADAPTHWLGDPESRQLLGDSLTGLVLKKTYDTTRRSHRFISNLSTAEQAELLEKIAFDPADYVCQQHTPLSLTPVLQENGIEKRPVVLLAFVCSKPEGCEVMQGGLTRVTTSTDSLIVSLHSVGFSKATWVPSHTPVRQVSLLRPATQVIRLERSTSEVSSRIADNLFWMGRYAERLEDSTRILRCMLLRLTNDPGTEESPELSALLHLMIKLEFVPNDFLGQHTLAGIERECIQIVFHMHRLGTLKEVQSRLQTLAFSLRDTFSTDTQRILNLLNAGMRLRHGQATTALNALDVINHIILHLSAFSGMEMENMTRGHGWRFLDLGRRLERAVNIVTLLQSGLVIRPSDPLAILTPILEIADSSMTYRRRYFGQPQWPTVVDLLIADESNPRSFAFQANALLRHMQRLPGAEAGGVPGGEEARLLIALRSTLAQLNLTGIAEGEIIPETAPLVTTLDSIAAQMRHLSDSLTRRFFSHGGVQSG